ncbi:hypothetical protein AAG906_029363 [Vitis piasezkii]
MENQPEDQHSQHGQENDPNLYRSMRDRMHPPRMSAPSCIIPPTEQLIIRPHIVPLLPTFHGMESENPYAHIKEFEDLMRLKLFPFTLKDKAKIWLNSLRPRSIRTWTELQVSRGWDEPNNREMGKRPVQQMSRGGMYNLSEDMEMKAKVAAMARKIEEMELRKVHEVQAISKPQQQANPCSIRSFEHMVEECPNIPEQEKYSGTS